MKNLVTWIAVLLTIQVGVEMAERGYAWSKVYQARQAVEQVKFEECVSRYMKNVKMTREDAIDQCNWAKSRGTL